MLTIAEAHALAQSVAVDVSEAGHPLPPRDVGEFLEFGKQLMNACGFAG